MQSKCECAGIMKSIYEKSSDLSLYYHVSSNRNVKYVLTRLSVK